MAEYIIGCVAGLICFMIGKYTGIKQERDRANRGISITCINSGCQELDRECF